ncbi:Transposase for insertion sequence element ISRM3 (plasmid) [Sphingobium sp. EP60837]|nr:Transposase for insertion sequence element ISRM3 [Sphingobium sp. EP60837]
MMYIGLPAHSCSRCLYPGWSHHMPQPVSRGGNFGTDILIPVTNAIEALNSKLRRAVRARGHFPNDEAATKLLYLILNRSEKEWKMPPREWNMAKAQFAVLFGKRFIRAMTA